MGRRGAIVAALAVATIGLAACGGSSKSKSSTSVAPASGAAVTYESFDASPKTVTVKLGQTVTWTNKDGPAHNVVSTSAPSGDKISSPSIPGGGTFTFTPSTVGTIKYVCTFHPQMTGYTIIVTK